MFCVSAMYHLPVKAGVKIILTKKEELIMIAQLKKFTGLLTIAVLVIAMIFIGSNMSQAKKPVKPTPTPEPTPCVDCPTMHVEIINASGMHLKGWRQSAWARVFIKDEFGDPVDGAVVWGYFSDCTETDEIPGITEIKSYWDEELQEEVFYSAAEFEGGSFPCTTIGQCWITFTVTDMTHPERTYNPDDNLITTRSNPCR
jgi:hypothetical protein